MHGVIMKFKSETCLEQQLYKGIRSQIKTCPVFYIIQTICKISVESYLQILDFEFRGKFRNESHTFLQGVKKNYYA